MLMLICNSPAFPLLPLTLISSLSRVVVDVLPQTLLSCPVGAWPSFLLQRATSLVWGVAFRGSDGLLSLCRRDISGLQWKLLLFLSVMSAAGKLMEAAGLLRMRALVCALLGVLGSPSHALNPPQPSHQSTTPPLHLPRSHSLCT
jgi:hypothetical protein